MSPRRPAEATACAHRHASSTQRTVDDVQQLAPSGPVSDTANRGIAPIAHIDRSIVFGSSASPATDLHPRTTGESFGTRSVRHDPLIVQAGPRIGRCGQPSRRHGQLHRPSQTVSRAHRSRPLDAMIRRPDCSDQRAGTARQRIAPRDSRGEPDFHRFGCRLRATVLAAVAAASPATTNVGMYKSAGAPTTLMTA